MPTANYYYLGTMLWPLNTISDTLAEEIGQTVDPDDEASLCAFFRDHLLPALQTDSDDTLNAYKDTLRYYLTTRTAPFLAQIQDQWDSPLRYPTDPWHFFLCLWKVLFPDESPYLGDLSGWVEVPNRDAAIAYRRTIP